MFTVTCQPTVSEVVLRAKLGCWTKKEKPIGSRAESDLCIQRLVRPCAVIKHKNGTLEEIPII